MSKKFTVNWFDGHIAKFTILLDKFKNLKDFKFLEVGSFEGRSACWFYDNFINDAEGATLTCVDTWEGSMEHSQSDKSSIWGTFCNNVKDYPKDKLIINRGNSSDMLKSLPKSNYDFIYIDGSHTARDVLSDAIYAFDLLKINGTMTFDDYLWKHYNNPILEPKVAIDSFLYCYQGYYKLIEQSGQVTIIKIK
jgi:predicted O-methyltransferase YrrM